MSGICQIHHLLRNMDRLPIWDIKGHNTDHSRQGTALPVGIDAESGQSPHSKGKVIIPPIQECVHGTASQSIQLRNHALGIRRHQTLLTNGTNMSLLFFTDRTACNQKQIRCLIRYCPLQIFHQFSHGNLPFFQNKGSPSQRDSVSSSFH